MAGGGLAEMQTGEGKTLAALLPAFLYALAGEGCHVVTANDYLGAAMRSSLAPCSTAWDYGWAAWQASCRTPSAGGSMRAT